MKIPRDISGTQLVRALRKLGYEETRQTGSHIRITTNERGQHHVTIPIHDPVKIGTLASILDDVAQHFVISRQDLIRQIGL